jgi:hypothetical protein
VVGGTSSFIDGGARLRPPGGRRPISRVAPPQWGQGGGHGLANGLGLPAFLKFDMEEVSEAEPGLAFGLSLFD